MQSGGATVENNMEAPLKFKNTTTLWSSSSTTGYLPKEWKNTDSKGYTYSMSCNSEDMEAAQVSINQWMDKEYR